MRIPRCLGALWLASGALVAAKSEPDVTLTKFDSRPSNLFLFEDSETALTLDREAGRVYLSKDAGGKWDGVDDITRGEATSIQPHPNDNQVAVVLGRGLTHWITYDQGKSWSKFTTKGLASRREPPLVFHSSDSKRILFNVREEDELFNSIGEVSQEHHVLAQTSC
jgi:photosystem II stability/assembly factor-like uncharacterized protein